MPRVSRIVFQDPAATCGLAKLRDSRRNSACCSAVSKARSLTTSDPPLFQTNSMAPVVSTTSLTLDQGRFS